ncbi:MAG: dioxygenase [Sandaracinaceae bacterium]|jgi:protocatechuate 3,4-dioxygenase beta subunit|nr:dioxygenase [Sandaracinaceae bacterium]MBK6809667.1 dioxygenase [Sandaracinaceae bacterium]MBK8412506.1 dioxygenase [Sandaracinaceae bacterium]MBK8589326.1 dioxygenase [Sandaracinaceae bacterium]MBP7684018.1 dioxygenase [Deltaproteobacteria bacterium]
MATEFQFTRRGFLWVALGTLAGACGTRREGAPASDATAATQDGTVLCGAPTGADIEGPYYVAGSLETATLGPGALTLRGAVMDARCQPLPGAMVDVWQADETGAYANDRYRAKQRAGADGSYQFQTTKPGNYLNGPQYRPAHIHLKASAPGFRSLTTQLYFPDDPYNGIDPWFEAARLVSMESGATARFDVVLAPV